MTEVESVEKQFREYIVATYPAPQNIQEKRAWSLFQAIQKAFTSDHQHWWIAEVPSDLIQLLATCAWVSLQYDKDQKIRWEQSDHDYIVLNLWRGFLKSILLTVRRKQHHVMDGQSYIGQLLIPGWLMDIAGQRDLYTDLE